VRAITGRPSQAVPADVIADLQALTEVTAFEGAS
jgi:hypothetical protein